MIHLDLYAQLAVLYISLMSILLAMGQIMQLNLMLRLEKRSQIAEKHPRVWTSEQIRRREEILATIKK